MKKLFILLITVVFLSACSINKADGTIEGVFENRGNIFIKYNNGETRQATFKGLDSQPSISSDYRTVVF